MHYSLLSRFEGCLWGMVWGERVGFDRHQNDAQGRSRVFWQLSAASWRSHTVFQILENLGRSQSADLATITVRVLQAGLPNQNCPDAIAIATLPIALFYHDDFTRQREALTQVFDAVSLDEGGQRWATIYAYSVAQAVKGQLQPTTFISQALAYLRVTESSVTATFAPAIEQLQWIQTCQANAASSSTLLKGFNPTMPTDRTLAIALAVFLQTPDDIRLAMARSAQATKLHPENRSAQSEDLQTLGALLGILTGAYTSSIGVPASWLAQAAEQNEFRQIQTLAGQLYAAWCGSYEPTQISPERLTVTAPWVGRSS